MKNTVTHLLTFILCFTLIACSDSDTNSNASYVEGTHYRALSEPFPSTSDQLVVTEFFWYGCPHCAQFEPVLEKWQATLPSHVTLEKSPAMWSEQMKLHAGIYYLSQTLDTAADLHAQLFNTIISIKSKKDLQVQKEALATLFESHGMPPEQFTQALDSFKIKGQVSQAQKRMKQAKLKGTPLIVVNGQYAVNNQSVKTLDDLLAITDFLIAKVQSEKSSHETP